MTSAFAIADAPSLTDERPTDDPLTFDAAAAAAAVAAKLARRGDAPGQLAIDPEHVARDVARLVLTLIEFVRQLLEAQAIRRMENGRLTEEQEERLGDTLMKARERIVELAEAFGVAPDELTMELGPLGKLV